MRTNSLASGMVDIPSRTIIETQLANVCVEARRLRLLLRTAKELERIESGKDRSAIGETGVPDDSR